MATSRLSLLNSCADIFFSLFTSIYNDDHRSPAALDTVITAEGSITLSYTSAFHTPHIHSNIATHPFTREIHGGLLTERVETF
ncbi:hypothetical protein ABKN59_006113 [Abortiporus biennis]